MSVETNVHIGGGDAATLAAILADLTGLLRLRTTPVVVQRFERTDDLATVERLRRPTAVHTFDQIVGMAARLGWTVGIDAADLVGDQCAAVVGLHPRDEEWLAGKPYAGVWYENTGDAAAHQAAMVTPSFGEFAAIAVSPAASGRLPNPDIVLIYATPAQMILFINGLQWSGYRKLEWGCVGESSCADSWGRALATGEPSLSIPCYAERRYGGVMEDELLMAIPPSYLSKVVTGVRALSANGLRYPIPPYGIQSDARAGLGVSYPKREESGSRNR